MGNVLRLSQAVPHVKLECLRRYGIRSIIQEYRLIHFISCTEVIYKQYTIYTINMLESAFCYQKLEQVTNFHRKLQ